MMPIAHTHTGQDRKGHDMTPFTLSLPGALLAIVKRRVTDAGVFLLEVITVLALAMLLIAWLVILTP